MYEKCQQVANSSKLPEQIKGAISFIENARKAGGINEPQAEQLIAECMLKLDVISIEEGFYRI
jgi:hypothetical protein